jgi:short-subunit dehydrogenase
MKEFRRIAIPSEAIGRAIMQKQGSGQIINLSSIGGHAAHPTGAVYSATKFAVLAISEGLRLENDKIRVTVISPGVTESELAESIDRQDGGDAVQNSTNVDASIMRFHSSTLSSSSRESGITPALFTITSIRP